MSKTISWATVVTVGITIIYALVGGAVVVWGNPGALSFQEYGDQLKSFVIAVGVLGIGRGLKAGLENHALLSGGDASLADLPDAPVGGDAPGPVAAAPRSSHV